jgi:hypothetical protein
MISYCILRLWLIQLLQFRFPRPRSGAFNFKAAQLLFVQMSPTLKYHRMKIQALVGQMEQVDETDLIYKGSWMRSAQQRLFQTLEADYSFPKATCRSLVNLMWNFLNETFGEKLHEGQIMRHRLSPPFLSEASSIHMGASASLKLTFNEVTKEVFNPRYCRIAVNMRLALSEKMVLHLTG